MPSIPKRENELKSDLFRELAGLGRDFFHVPVQDVRRSGTPDFALNGCAATTWWEVKHATPHFESFGLQEVTCKLLARLAYCRYLIYVDSNADMSPLPSQFTAIVHPDIVFGKDGKLDWLSLYESNQCDVLFLGHAHMSIAKHMSNVHKTLADRKR